MAAFVQSQVPIAPVAQQTGSVRRAPLEFSAPDQSWDDKVAVHPDATIFHSTAWGNLLKHTYGHRLCYAEFKAAGHAPAALVPMAEVRSWLTGTRGVTLPFADACEPLVFQLQPGIFDELCEFGRTRRWKYLELRGGALLPREATPSTEFAVHTLDLSRGPTAIEEGFEPATRRALRKANSSGLTAEISSSVEAVRAYYRLHCSTRRRHGAPPQSWGFFRNLHRFLLAPGNGFVVLARLGRQALAGAVFLHTNRHAVFKFGATDHAFQEMRPSNLVMGASIRHLAGAGIKVLSFGRTSLANRGLRRFKRSWGATESITRYYRYDLRERRWLAARDRASGLHARILRRMPVCVNRAIGALLYTHLD